MRRPAKTSVSLRRRRTKGALPGRLMHFFAHLVLKCGDGLASGKDRLAMIEQKYVIAAGTQLIMVAIGNQISGKRVARAKAAC